MAPINWLTMYFFMILLLLLFNIMNYYIFFKKTNKNININYENQNFMNKWMW